jgi:branched-chain amino acid transport system substrate-binding protein
MLRTLILIIFFGALSVNADQRLEQAAPQEIRIAVVAPITGGLGNYGNEIVQGAQLAVDQLGEAERVRLLVEDACLPADTVRAAHRLIDIENIQAIVGSYCVVGMVPMAAITEKKNIIAFHTSAVADAILNAGDFTFTTNIAIKDEARKLAAYAYNTMRVRRAAVLSVLTQWGQDYEKYFVEEFEKLGGVVAAAFQNPLGTNDFRSEITRITAANADVIFIPNVGDGLGSALKQLREMGLKQPVLAADEAEEQSVLDAAGAAAEGLTFLSPALPESGEEAMRFKNEFHKRYGTEPGILAANAYDATKITINLLRECNLSNACVKSKLYQLKDYPGMSGEFSITEEGGTIKTFVRKTVSRGKFILSD